MGHMSDTKVGDRVEIIRCYDGGPRIAGPQASHCPGPPPRGRYASRFGA